MFTKLLTYCICKPGPLSFGESCGMHLLLKDGKGLAIINTLFCRDGSKALPEKKNLLRASWDSMAVCTWGIGAFPKFRKAVRGRLWPRWGLGTGELQGQEKNHWFEIWRPGFWFQLLRSPSGWHWASHFSSQELGLSIWKMGGWDLQTFSIFEPGFRSDFSSAETSIGPPNGLV